MGNNMVTAFWAAVWLLGNNMVNSWPAKTANSYYYYSKHVEAEGH